MNFRDFEKQLCIIPDKRYLFTLDPEMKSDATGVLAYGYVDHTAGLTFEALALVKHGNGDCTVVHENPTTSMKFRATMDELEQRKTALQDIYDFFEEASETPDLCIFRENDKLTVVDDTLCSSKGHFTFNAKISLHFENDKEKIVPVCRCSTCQQFQITSQEFADLISEFGMPNCHVEYAIESRKFDCRFSDTSLFYNMGYSVSANDGLSSSQRQAILKLAIDQGKATKQDVISFLLQRININGMKAGNEKALEKWREDYLYIKSL